MGNDTTDTIGSATLFLDGRAATVGDQYWYFPRVLCTEFSLTVDIDTEEVIGWTSSWGADGIFYFPGQTGTQSGQTA